MTTPAIQIQDLHKRYGRRSSQTNTEAVRGLTLEIQTGDTWALAGPNGAGKTTTLNCLLGLLRPTQGTVSVLGHDPWESESRTKIGFQSEVFFSYAYRKGGDALRLYGKLSGLKDPDLQDRVEKVLELVELNHARHQLLGTYSKGMMQRLGLAQSLLHDPSLVIWDEPTTGLDPEGRRLVADLVTKLKEEGKTVLLSTHILSDIERVCDHLAIIHEGRRILAGQITTLLSDQPGKSLEDIYLDTVRRRHHVP